MTSFLLLFALAAGFSLLVLRLTKSVLIAIVAGTLIPCFCYKWLGVALHGSDPFDQVELYISIVIVFFANVAALAISSAVPEDD